MSDSEDIGGHRGADNRRESVWVGVDIVTEEGDEVAVALGDESAGEWIRMEWEHGALPLGEHNA